jgi:DNA-directed RNA polymerase specialized sigma24 family protein
MERAGGRDDGAPRGIVPSPIVSRALELAETRDRDALAFLYARFADDVHKYLLAVLENCGDAEEATQRVFANLPELIERYRGRSDSPLRWLLQAAHELYLDPHRALQPASVEAARRRAAAIAESAPLSRR